jgi:hypothetical protein
MAANPVLQRAKDHFSNQPVKEIEVPEWGEDGKPFVFYSKPFTIQEKGRLAFMTKDKDPTEALIEVLIMKAMDAEGEKVFQLTDKIDLRNNVDADVISRAVNDIMGIDLEELEKN